MIANAPGVFVRLKAETHPEHVSLERKLAILEQPLTTERYVQILSAFYGFYNPWSRELQPWMVPVFGTSAALREKCVLLIDDLLHFGVNLASLPLYTGWSSLPSLPAAMGSLYVMEGATLGGQIISRKVDRELALPDGNGCRFFTGYGPHTGAMWRDFQERVLERTQPGSEDEMVSAAADTFRRFRCWLEETGL